MLLALVEKGKLRCSLGPIIPQAAWLAMEPCRANDQLKGKKIRPPLLLHVWAPSLQTGLSQRVTVLFSIPKSGESILSTGRGGRDSKASTFSLATNLLPASLCLAAPRD